jgi:hypothetical protein
MAKRWTFIVYLAGDNNLDQFGRLDLLEMKAVGSTSDVDVVAQFDGMEDGATRRYHLSADRSLADDVVDELPEVNTGDPSALVDCVTWALEEFPADRTALVLWNHGSGWRDDDIYRLAGGAGAADTDEPRSLVRGIGQAGVRRALFRSSIASVMDYPAEVRGILFDDTSRDFLDSRELGRVLDELMAARGGRKLDLIGFDACLMSMIEVAYGVRHAFEVMVGSQEIEPGEGWPYQHILTALSADPDASADALGRIIVDAYVEQMSAADPKAAVTQSAVRLDRLDVAVEGVRALADALAAALEEPSFHGKTLLPALRRVQKFRDSECVDLGHLARLLGSTRAGRPANGSLPSAAAGLEPLFASDSAESIVPFSRTHGRSVRDASGLSIYVPLIGAPSPAYGDLEFAATSTWSAFLDAFARRT